MNFLSASHKLALIFGMLLLWTSLSWMACEAEPQTANLTRVKAHLPKEPRSLFPLVATTAYETQVSDLIFQYLVHFDPASGQLVPQLVETIPEAEVITEGEYTGLTSFRFKLREGARFSDGSPLTVNDVIFTYQAIFYPGLARSPLRASIRELVDVLPDPDDERSFQVIISSNNLLGAAYYGNVPILASHVYDADNALKGIALPILIAATDTSALPAGAKGFALDARLAPFGKTRVIGSGPYKLDRWVDGQFIRLVRDSAFWGAEINEPLFYARPDTIEFYPVPDETAALLMLENGDLDVMANVSPREAIRLRRDSSRFQLFTPRQLTRTFVYINTADPLLADPNTRRGLAHLMNVNYFIDSVQLGFGEQLHGPFHPAQPNEKGTARAVPFSIDSARIAFARAGWIDSNQDGVLDRMEKGQAQQLKLEYLYPSISENSKTLALLFAEDAKRAGILIEPIGKEFGAMLGDLAQRNFQLVQGAIGGEALPDDPYDLWHTSSNTAEGKNRSGFGSPFTDALIDSIRVNRDAKSRQKQYTSLSEEIHLQQPVIFLLVPQDRIVVRAGLDPMITERRPGFYLPGFTASKLEQAN